jgi:hypothetical protein
LAAFNQAVQNHEFSAENFDVSLLMIWCLWNIFAPVISAWLVGAWSERWHICLEWFQCISIKRP